MFSEISQAQKGTYHMTYSYVKSKKQSDLIEVKNIMAQNILGTYDTVESIILTVFYISLSRKKKLEKRILDVLPLGNGKCLSK